MTNQVKSKNQSNFFFSDNSAFLLCLFYLLSPTLTSAKIHRTLNILLLGLDGLFLLMDVDLINNKTQNTVGIVTLDGAFLQGKAKWVLWCYQLYCQHLPLVSQHLPAAGAPNLPGFTAPHLVTKLPQCNWEFQAAQAPDDEGFFWFKPN